MAAQHEPGQVLLRSATGGDEGFVFSSWLRSYEDVATAMGCPRGAYYAAQHRRIEALLRRPGVRLVVACAPDAPDQLLGWACTESGRALHYAYVKHPLRRMGVARALLAEAGLRPGCVYTHHTRAGGMLARSLGAHYAPEELP